MKNLANRINKDFFKNWGGDGYGDHIIGMVRRYLNPSLRSYKRRFIRRQSEFYQGTFVFYEKLLKKCGATSETI